MPISVRCPDCGVKSQYADRYAGQVVACKACGADVEVKASSGSGGKNKKGRKKSASNTGVFVVVAVLGGFVMLGIAGTAAVVWMAARPKARIDAVLSPQQPATPAQGASPLAGTPPAGSVPANPSPIAPPLGNNAANRAVPSATPSGFAANSATADANTRLTFSKPTPWQVSSDPPAASTALQSAKPLRIKLDRNNLRDPAVVYPVTPSPLVMIKASNRSDSPFEIYNLTNGQKGGQVPGMLFLGPVALSPDGAYAALGKSGGNIITVYDIKGKKPLGELMTAQAPATFRPTLLALPRPDRLVAISQLEQGIKVWELPSGNFLRTITCGPQAHPHVGHAFSPSGRYLAINAEFLKKTVEIYDLESGEVVATIAINGQTSFLELTGLGFSADGTELALMYDVNHVGQRRDFTQFVVWNLASGEITSDFDIEPRLKPQLNPPYQKERLESFPNGRRWLVHSAGIVDRDLKQLVYSYPKLDRVELTANRRVMGNDWLISVVTDTADARLESTPIEESVIAAAAKSAAAGGLAMDADLPPLTASDYTTAAAAVASNDWQAVADPGPTGPQNASSIAVEAGAGKVREVVVSRSDQPRIAIRVAAGENLDDPAIRAYEMLPPETRRVLNSRPPQPLAKNSRLDVYDASSGNRVSQLELPFSGSLLAFSPNGQRALVELHRGEGRLDLFTLQDPAGPELAWRPYRAATEERERHLAAADFIDNQHVATLSAGRELAVWALDPLTPRFRVEEVRRFEVSPGGKWIAAIRGNALSDKDVALFDAQTGDGQGIVELSGFSESLAFHPNGKWLAISHGDAANRQISIIDIAAGQISTRFPIPDVAQSLQWTGDDFLLLGGNQLISIPMQAVVWNYEGSSSVIAQNSASLSCVFAAPVGNRWQIKSVTLPSADVAPKLEGAQLASLAVVKPGDAVSLQVTVGNDPLLAKLKTDVPEKVRQRLIAAQLNPMEGSQKVSISVDISLKSGETVTLSKIGSRDDQQPVTRKTIHFVVKYLVDSKVVWEIERRAGNLDRLLVRLTPGESAQQATDRLMLEGAESIAAGLQLPAYVFGEKARAGLGTSPLISIK